MINNYLDISKQEWSRASDFPADKESVYPDHKRVQEFDLHNNKKVYEYGIGGGSDVMSYLRRGNHVTGTDIVPKNLEVTRQRIIDAGLPIENVNLVLLEDSYPLPFESNIFDVISSHGVLHHVIDVKPVVKELYRVCKPDGLIYIMVYTDLLFDYHLPQIQNLMRVRGISQNEAFCWCTDGEGTPYARFYTTEQACELLTDAGFEVLDYNHWLNDWFLTIKGCKS